MKVSYNGYQRMYNNIKEDIFSEIEKLLRIDSDEGYFKYSRTNEKKIGRFLGGKYTTGTSCGTAALQFSLIALGIGKGDEVITVPNSYIATALSISNTGARPVFVDVNKDTMLMDLSKMKNAISDKTKAIMPVHLFGQMCNMKKIMRIAKEKGLFVIEDACQAHLSRYDNRLPGKYSNCACYSFFPNKNLGGISNGGMVVSKDKKLIENVADLRNPTSNKEIVLKSHRTPAYLDWNQIAFIKSKMRYLKKWIEKRRQISQRYIDELENLPLILPKTSKKAYHTYRNFIIRTEKRDQLDRYLKKKGIDTRTHYDKPIHLYKSYQYLRYKKGDFPVSEQVCEQMLSLPNNPFMREEEIIYTIKSIKKILDRLS